MLPSPQEMIDILNNLKTEPRTSVFACSGKLLALTVVVGEQCHWRRTYSLANGMNVDYLATKLWFSATDNPLNYCINIYAELF